MYVNTSTGDLWTCPAGTWIQSSHSAGGGTVTSFSAGNLSPLFTSNVINPTSTPNLTFTLSNATAHSFFGNNTGSSAAPAYVQPAFTDLSGSAACGQMPALTGDATSSAGSCATTLASVVTAGTCGDATHSCGLTYDAKGRITAATNNTISGGGGTLCPTPLESHSASSSAAIPFTSWQSASYHEYEIHFQDIVLSGANDIAIRFSSNGGTSYDSTSGNYYWASLGFASCGGCTGFGGGADTWARVTGSTFTTTSGYSGSCIAHLIGWTSGIFMNGMADCNNITNGDDGSGFKAERRMQGFRYFGTSTAVNALEVVPTAGTITSGKIWICAAN